MAKTDGGPATGSNIAGGQGDRRRAREIGEGKDSRFVLFQRFHCGTLDCV